MITMVFFQFCEVGGLVIFLEEVLAKFAWIFFKKLSEFVRFLFPKKWSCRICHQVMKIWKIKIKINGGDDNLCLVIYHLTTTSS